MSHTAPQAPASSRRAAPYRDRRSLGTRAGTGVERPALEKRGVRAAQVCWLVGAWRRGGGTVLPARAHRCGAVTGRGSPEPDGKLQTASSRLIRGSGGPEGARGTRVTLPENVDPGPRCPGSSLERGSGSLLRSGQPSAFGLVPGPRFAHLTNGATGEVAEVGLGLSPRFLLQVTEVSLRSGIEPPRVSSLTARGWARGHT